MLRGEGAHSRLAAGSFLPSASRAWCLLALTLALFGVCCSGRRLSIVHGASESSETISKKGVCGWYVPGVEGALQQLSVSWFYTWKASAGAAGIVPPPGVEHVPMIWGAQQATPENLAAATAEPGSGVLLGFNEPDNVNQSAMPVEQALALWPALAATGRRLGSPAVEKNAAVPGGWLDQFMAGAAAAGHPPDFIAVHYYGEDPTCWDVETAVADMKDVLLSVYEKYGRPIWVTEWALVRWHPFPSIYPPCETQAAFAIAAAEMMNALPWVERYAFFALWPYSLEAALGKVDPSGWNGEDLDSSNLFEKDGSMTAVGEAYKSA